MYANTMSPNFNGSGAALGEGPEIGSFGEANLGRRGHPRLRQPAKGRAEAPSGPYKCQGLRISRGSRRRLASSSPIKRSFLGSQTTLRFSRMAMSLMWQSVSDQTDSSIGQTVSARLFTQSRKLRTWSELLVSWTLQASSFTSMRLSGWRLRPLRSTCTQPRSEEHTSELH